LTTARFYLPQVIYALLLEAASTASIWFPFAFLRKKCFFAKDTKTKPKQSQNNAKSKHGMGAV